MFGKETTDRQINECGDFLRPMQAIVTELGATGPGDMGKVMAAVKTQLAGQADMGLVSAAVKQALTR